MTVWPLGAVLVETAVDSALTGAVGVDGVCVTVVVTTLGGRAVPSAAVGVTVNVTVTIS